MKKLMALAIVFSLAGATKSWAFFGIDNVSYDGSLEVSGHSANNETDQSAANDHRGNTQTRVTVGMNAQVTENVTGRVEAVRSPRLYGTAATTVTSEQAKWTFENAYVDIANLWDHTFRLGRQYVGNANDLVWYFGHHNDDSLTTTAIDGLSVNCRKFDFVHLEFFTGKANEDDTIANTDADDAAANADVNLSNLSLSFPKIIPGGNINVGYLWGIDSTSSTVSNDNKLTILRVGVNGGIKENMLTYRAEYLQNGGEQENGAASSTKYKGSAIDLGLGFNPAETGIGTFGVAVNYAMASGDDNTTDNDDESFNDFSTFGINTSNRVYGEIFGKSNTLTGAGLSPRGQGLGSNGTQGLTVLNLGLKFMPKVCDKSTIKLDYYAFNNTEDQINNTAAADKIGTEIDLSYGYKQSENVGLEFGYAMFSPDDGITGTVNATNDEDITKLYARTNIKWGGESK